MRPAVISLCDLTGNFVRPWAEAGYECWCVDVEHSIRRDRVDGPIHYVWGDARSWTPPEGLEIAFVAAFPPCTHVTVSGTRDHAKKRGHLSSVPHIGKPDHYFDPFEYAGYLPDIEAENTRKKTCLWTGNGFVMPERRPAPEPHRQDCWKASPSDDRADVRSATPLGFARAVFAANGRAILQTVEAA